MDTFDQKVSATQGETKDLSASLGDASTKAKVLQTAAGGAGKGIDNLGQSTQKSGGLLSVFGQELSKISPLFGRIASGARTLGAAITTALGPVGLVIAAIVAAFAALVKIFAGTQEGADRLNRVIQPLLSVFDALLGIAQRAGKVLVDIFSSPIESAGKLADVIKSVVVEAIRSLTVTATAAGEILAAVLSGDQVQLGLALSKLTTEAGRQFDNVKNAVDGVNQGIRNLTGELITAAAAGARIADIDVELRKVALERAQNEGRINRELQEQLAITQDVTKSAAERQAAGEKFKALNRELTGFEQRRLDLEIERGNLAASTSDTLDEEKIRIAELVSAKDQALADEAAGNRRVNNQLNALNKQAADQAIAQAKRVAEERRKAEEQAARDAQKRLEAIERTEEQIGQIVGKAQEERFQAGISIEQREERQIELRYQKEVEAAQAAFAQLVALNEGNAEAIEEIRRREAEAVKVIKENETAEIIELVKSRDEQLAELERQQAEAELEQLREQQEERLAIFTSVSDRINSVIEGAASGQIATAEEASKALLGIALDTVEKIALTQIAQAQATALAQPDSVATFGASGIARGVILAALIKAAFAGLRGLLGRKHGEAYVGGPAMFSGTDGHMRFLDDGERVVRTKTNQRYFPILEMMEKGTFDRWLSTITTVNNYSTTSTTSAPASFSDRRIVGALGGVGSLSEQRKQTAILKAMARTRNLGKRYYA